MQIHEVREAWFTQKFFQTLRHKDSDVELDEMNDTFQY